MNKQTTKLLRSAWLEISYESHYTSERRLQTSVAELTGADAVYNRLVIDICPTCDKQYIEFRNEDPGSTAEAIGVIHICPSCSDDYLQGKIDMGCHTDWDYVYKIREERGLGNVWEVRNKFKKWEFDCYLKSEGKYPQWYATNLDKADEEDIKALKEYYQESLREDATDFIRVEEVNSHTMSERAREIHEVSLKTRIARHGIVTPEKIDNRHYL